MLMQVDNPSGTDEIPQIAEQLIERICQSDSAALATLFDVFADRAYARALPVVGCRGLAEEVVSDVFMQIWLTADHFDARRGSAEAWIMMMVRARSLDRLRREARHREQSTHPIEEAVSRIEQLFEEPSSQFDSETTANAVREALKVLNPGQQRVIKMAFFRGFSHQEIAARLGMPLGTVKSHCRRGLARMRTVLQLYHSDNS